MIDDRQFLFVYAKEGWVRCLTPDQARSQQSTNLLDAGWHHTATIDAAGWIEHLCNDLGDPSDKLDQLQFKS